MGNRKKEKKAILGTVAVYLPHTTTLPKGCEYSSAIPPYPEGRIAKQIEHGCFFLYEIIKAQVTGS